MADTAKPLPFSGGFAFMDWMEANCCKCAQHFVEDETPRCQKGYLGPNFYEWPEGWSGEQDDVTCRDLARVEQAREGDA